MAVAWHGSQAARQGMGGSVYPVAPLLGPGRGAAAAGRPRSEGSGGGGHKKECPAPCSWPAATTPHLWVCDSACARFPGSAPLGLAGGTMDVGRRSLTSPRRWRWRRGRGTVDRVRDDGRAPRAGGLEGPEKLEVHLRLEPGGEDKGAGGGHPHDGHHHWSVWPGQLGPRCRV
ncbi:MAG: hypothetical protein KKD99_00575 [Proteobacteria bacterium]|nr:hypothetical protein [Pseudomonadota bacterium]MBU4355509.1 hypothetical protein [Pseudomonadota bacterium]MBU4447046.1 hypothetical protein [Pseudomonadota bacterium]MCG2773128.1 hypothetical protein [Desulfobacterales bacterium]